jgi:ABC-type polysaccharide/polyol phosphate transport system ATPase subunit
MYGRLAFSVAVNMEPDILLIDEALSVGDARFKEKSFEKIRELCAEARTIFMVSHGLNSIRRLCNEVIWLHQGQIVMRDEPEVVIEAYRRFLDVGETDAVLEDL